MRLQLESENPQMYTLYSSIFKKKGRKELIHIWQVGAVLLSPC